MAKSGRLWGDPQRTRVDRPLKSIANGPLLTVGSNLKKRVFFPVFCRFFVVFFAEIYCFSPSL